jgi:LysM repeat protein
MGAGHVIEYSAPILAQKPEIKQEAVASTNMVEKITNIEYTVKRGETLTGIAKKYEISVADLKAANDMTTNKISPLQKLIIPYKTLTFIVETENQATQQEETPPQDEKTQRTQNVLSKIDAAFAKPTPQAPTQQTYTVQKGDTFYSLARKYGCTVEKLKEWNHKEDDYLKIGENIVIGENKD